MAINTKNSNTELILGSIEEMMIMEGLFMKKKLIALLLSTCMALSIVACGNSEGNSSGNANNQAGSAADAEATQSADNIKLTISWWGNQVRNERTQQVLDLYSGLNQVEFDGQFSEYADYFSKLSTAAAGHNLPDVIQMDYAYLDQYAQNGLLLDLTPYIENGTIDVSNISESMLNSGMVDGKIYAISTGANAPALMYNKTLLDELGITVKDYMTWDDFYAICKEVDEKTGIKTDFGLSTSDQLIQYVLRSTGGILYGDGALGVTQEQMDEFFKIAEKIYSEGWNCNPATYAERSNGTPEQSCLCYWSSNDTRSWCAFSWSNALAAHQNAVGDQFEVAMTTWPSDDCQASNYLKPAMFFSISTDSANPQAAAEFLNYWTNDVDANKILLGERGVPVSSAVAEAITPMLDEISAEVNNYVSNVAAPVSSTIDPPNPAVSTQIVTVMSDLGEQMRYGRLDAMEASRMLYKQANELMAESAE